MKNKTLVALGLSTLAIASICTVAFLSPNLGNVLGVKGDQEYNVEFKASDNLSWEDEYGTHYFHMTKTMPKSGYSMDIGESENCYIYGDADITYGNASSSFIMDIDLTSGYAGLSLGFVMDVAYSVNANAVVTIYDEWDNSHSDVINIPKTAEGVYYTYEYLTKTSARERVVLTSIVIEYMC